MRGVAAVLCAILVWEDTGTFEGFADTGRTVAYFDMADVRKPTSSNAGIIAGTGALTAEGWPGSTALPWGYAVCADTGSVKVDIDGSLSLLAGGINAQAGSISVKAGSIDIAGLVRAGSAVLAEASGSLSIEKSSEYGSHERKRRGCDACLDRRRYHGERR